jgi:hypothetical protein
MVTSLADREAEYDLGFPVSAMFLRPRRGRPNERTDKRGKRRCCKDRAFLHWTLLLTSSVI